MADDGSASHPASRPREAHQFAGIEYESRFGDNYQNWAVFERPVHEAITDPIVGPVRRDDPALSAALAALGLKLE